MAFKIQLPHSAVKIMDIGTYRVNMVNIAISIGWVDLNINIWDIKHIVVKKLRQSVNYSISQ